MTNSSAILKAKKEREQAERTRDEPPPKTRAEELRDQWRGYNGSAAGHQHLADNPPLGATEEDRGVWRKLAEEERKQAQEFRRQYDEELRKEREGSSKEKTTSGTTDDTTEGDGSGTGSAGEPGGEGSKGSGAGPGETDDGRRGGEGTGAGGSDSPPGGPDGDPFSGFGFTNTGTGSRSNTREDDTNREPGAGERFRAWTNNLKENLNERADQIFKDAQARAAAEADRETRTQAARVTIGAQRLAAAQRKAARAGKTVPTPEGGGGGGEAKG